MDDIRRLLSRQSVLACAQKGVGGIDRGVVLARLRLCGMLLLGTVACCLSGCSLFVMAGKMILGDPKVRCDFTVGTHVDLAKDGKKILVVCSTPEAIKSDFPSLNFDLLEGVTRRLKREQIAIVNSNDVATWMDDNGGIWESPSELAEHFDADYIIHIDLDEFTYREEQSPSLFRGRANGNVFAYRVEKIDGRKDVTEAFVKELMAVYPEQYPVSADRMSASVFRRKFLDRVSAQIARLFYDHRISETIY